MLSGKPLFPGRDYHNQLTLILDVLGTPTLDEFYAITTRRSRDYIRALPVRSAFVSLGSFMENFASQTFLAPRRETGGGATTWVLERNNKPGARWPLLAALLAAALVASAAWLLL